MKITATLSRYLAKTYFINTILLFMALLAVIYLFDTVELIRRASKQDDVSLILVLQMGLLKLPEVGQVLFPFAILFSAMFTFWQLTKRYELIVVRASGFSIWQFLTPIIGVAVTIGILQIAVINPIGAILVRKFEQLESTHLKRQNSQIAIFKEGFWIRQGIENEQGYIIMHAERIDKPWILKKLTILYFDNSDTFKKRVNAETATLEKGKWLFKDVTIYNDKQNATREKYYILPTYLTIEDVENSFSSPETMSFWQLPGHIRILEETGFDASRLRVHYHHLLAQPLMFAAMVLLAATVSMRPPRLRGGAALFGIGIFIGFFVFFISSFLQALGASQQIPIILAAWAPALICFLLGLSVMINLEDG
ncbi:MAG: LPS export ABC transporter permease LptG [Alphaproteobacteria bacterium]|nr:LPS export ABC transporter permease LptG [Alphaproteobacteria bacterium]